MSLLLSCAASATSVRVATYNVDCSDTGVNNNLLGVARVVQGMGNHHIAGNAQAVDVLALQELLDTNNNTITSTSLPAMVSQLNALYGAGVYAYDHTPDPTTGGVQFNGPSGLVYNTHTIKVISATPLGYDGDSFNFVPRAPMRYQLRPVGYGPSADFYVYVSHYKSGSGSFNDFTRLNEAAEIRADADALGDNAHIIYAGDHNLFSSSDEQSYQYLTSPGAGEAYDPAAPSQVWTADAAHVGIETESATAVQFRDDVQLTSGSVWNPSGIYTDNGLRLANDGNGSIVVFGNGSSPSVPGGGTAQSFAGGVNYPGNHTLDDLSNASLVLTTLTTASDHLPVEADYSLVGVSPLPEPLSVSLIACAWPVVRRRNTSHS